MNYLINIIKLFGNAINYCTLVYISLYEIMETPKMIETIINILITLISGGFIIFLIEIENRKDREYDKYFYFMQPLTNKSTISR